jgi:hypothetical protein
MLVQIFDKFSGLIEENETTPENAKPDTEKLLASWMETDDRLRWVGDHCYIVPPDGEEVDIYARTHIKYD